MTSRWRARLTVMGACWVLLNLSGCGDSAMTGCDAWNLVAEGKLERFEKWAVGVAPAIPDCNGVPLMVALNEEDLEYAGAATGILLRLGVDANTRNPQNGRTALHGAGNLGDFEAFKALLEHGADPNVQDDRGTTPLMSIAGTKGNPRDRDMVALLVKSGASLRIRDHRGYMAADYAKGSENTELRHYLEQLESKRAE